MSYDPGTYVTTYDPSSGAEVSGVNHTESDGSGHFDGYRYTPDGGKQHVSTYYHDGYSFETKTSSDSGK